MALPRRAGYVLLVIGILIFSLTVVVSGSTDRACPGIDSVVYDTVGVYPAEFSVTGTDLSNLEVRWYDGCNWRSAPLLFPILGIVAFIVGLGIARTPLRSVETGNE
jgi:hypothetical protein